MDAWTVPPACKTCKYWDQRYPKNPNIGVCKRMGALQWQDGKELSIHITTNPEAANDFEAIRTWDTFGCRWHSDYFLMQLQAGTL